MKIITNTLKLSERQLEAIAWSFGELIKEFFLNPENKKAFEEWKQKRGETNHEIEITSP